jgi:chemotaxis protein MotB
MADPSNPKQPTIIVQRKRGGHGPHHGGAWKVAYADFVTAMMAFFLLLWLLNVTTDVQKKGIADYFAPENVSTSTSGVGGVLGGTSVLSPGAMPYGAGGFFMGVPQTSGNPADEDYPDKTFPSKPAPNPVPDATESASVSGKPGNGAGKAEGSKASLAALQAALAAKDETSFASAEAQLRQAMQDPKLHELRDNLTVDRTPEGLRIQIVDQQRQSMFATGSPLPNPHLRELVGLAAQVINKLPNRIVITGHTDSIPYPPNSDYTNWELSMDRANACRRALLASGVAPDRIAYVTGKADTDPLIKDNPADPRNRRISFVLLRQAPATPVAGAPARTPPAAVAQTAPPRATVTR